MKRNNILFVYLIIIFVMMLTACNSGTEYKRNADYTYGTLTTDGIESVYKLEGTPSQYCVDIPSGASKGANSSYFINVCKTDSGGIVAYGEGLYVYSPDKNDKNSVINALISECTRKQKE